MSEGLNAEFGKIFPLERPSALERKAYHNEKIQLTDELRILDRERLGIIVDILNHPATERLIGEGHITFGAIKPNAQQSKLGVNDDVSAEEEILKHIRERKDTNLEIMFAVSLKPSREELEDFYKEIKENLQTIPNNGETVWDKVMRYTESGPITYFLLYSPNGYAVEEWRGVIGATNPVKADENSIRGKFALGMPNNLVHGSSGDTKEEAVTNVKHEVYWLRDRLVNVQKELNNQKPLNLSKAA